LTSLQKVDLNFSSCKQIQDDGLGHLGQALKSLVSLKALTLQFGRCKQITGQGLRHLGEGIVTLSSLKSLGLGFWKQEIELESQFKLEKAAQR